jgi:hypothetical protein
MYAHRNVDLGVLTIDIAVDDDVSDEMDFRGWRGSARNLGISGPGTLTGTAKVQVSSDAGQNWRDLQSAGADITIPADGHVVIQSVSFDLLRIVSSGNEIADREFVVVGEE